MTQSKKEGATNTPEYADSSAATSSADYVDQHLQSLEKTGGSPLRHLSPEEQLFTKEELARLINPDKLKALMTNGEDLVSYLTSEFDNFEE